MIIFYAGAFGYIGKLGFVGSREGCCYSDHVAVKRTESVSTAIPIHEEDTSNVVGELKEGGVEVDTARVPSGLMHLAEYYMAVRTLYQNPDIKIVILDRMPSIDIPHFISNVEELLDTDTTTNRCVLEGIETEYGIVSYLDLELARMLHPYDMLEIPAARSQLIRYAAINRLIKGQRQQQERADDGIASYEELLGKIGANKNRLEKLRKDLSQFDKKFCIFEKEDKQQQVNSQKNANASLLQLKPNIEHYWQRVFSASMKLTEQIFDTPDNEYPLLYEKEISSSANNSNYSDSGDDSISNEEKNSSTSSNKKRKKEKHWITANDLDYLILVMIYALLRLAWEKNILVIGLVKDIAAAEMIKTVVPILQNSHKISLRRELPRYNSDKMLLQTASVINGEFTNAPWRTFEFDTCFKTMAPINNDNNNKATVTGAFKNLISGERMFLKSYIQLWCSKSDPTVRSHVFSYDRPCYPNFDKPGEISLYHKDGNVMEEIEPIIHFDKDSEISHLVMNILCSMSLEVIPECLGHNYPLFLADKKAKSILEGTKSAYISTASFEISKSQFSQQALFESKFREYRSRLENSRRS
jgi:hypothetical protein